MALIRRLSNDNDDFVYGHGKTDYATKSDCVGLNVKTRVREWKYNWFADYEKGIDWRTRLSNKNQKELLDEDIQNIILATDEVVTITEFESTLDTSIRQYTAQVSISTVYGEEELEIKVGG